MSLLEHVFSVEMRSKRFVKNISISDEAHELVLFEGTLGAHVDATLLEGDVLEIIGRNGVIRISLTSDQLRNVLKKQAKTLQNEKEITN